MVGWKEGDSLITIPTTCSLHTHIPLIKYFLEILHLPIHIRGSFKSIGSSIETLMMKVEDHLEFFILGVGVIGVGFYSFSPRCFTDTIISLISSTTPE
jgi:hypothetical protein